MTNKITICTINLSQAQQNFLKDYLKEEINRIADDVSSYKWLVSAEWNNCNPNDGGYSIFAFKRLNDLKSRLRKAKKRLKKFQAIQKEVKSCFVDTFEVEDDNV
jgi:hypothetical protein